MLPFLLAIHMFHIAGLSFSPKTGISNDSFKFVHLYAVLHLGFPKSAESYEILWITNESTLQS